MEAIVITDNTATQMLTSRLNACVEESVFFNQLPEMSTLLLGAFVSHLHDTFVLGNALPLDVHWTALLEPLHARFHDHLTCFMVWCDKELINLTHSQLRSYLTTSACDLIDGVYSAVGFSDLLGQLLQHVAFLIEHYGRSAPEISVPFSEDSLKSKTREETHGNDIKFMNALRKELSLLVTQLYPIACVFHRVLYFIRFARLLEVPVNNRAVSIDRFIQELHIGEEDIAMTRLSLSALESRMQTEGILDWCKQYRLRQIDFSVYSDKLLGFIANNIHIHSIYNLVLSNTLEHDPSDSHPFISASVTTDPYHRYFPELKPKKLKMAVNGSVSTPLSNSSLLPSTMSYSPMSKILPVSFVLLWPLFQSACLVSRLFFKEQEEKLVVENMVAHTTAHYKMLLRTETANTGGRHSLTFHGRTCKIMSRVWEAFSRMRSNDQLDWPGLFESPPYARQIPAPFSFTKDSDQIKLYACFSVLKMPVYILSKLVANLDIVREAFEGTWPPRCQVGLPALSKTRSLVRNLENVFPDHLEGIGQTGSAVATMAPLIFSPCNVMYPSLARFYLDFINGPCTLLNLFQSMHTRTSKHAPILNLLKVESTYAELESIFTTQSISIDPDNWYDTSMGNTVAYVTRQFQQLNDEPLRLNTTCLSLASASSFSATSPTSTFDDIETAISVVEDSLVELANQKHALTLPSHIPPQPDAKHEFSKEELMENILKRIKVDPDFAKSLLANLKGIDENLISPAFSQQQQQQLQQQRSLPAAPITPTVPIVEEPTVKEFCMEDIILNVDNGDGTLQILAGDVLNDPEQVKESMHRQTELLDTMSMVIFDLNTERLRCNLPIAVVSVVRPIANASGVSTAAVELPSATQDSNLPTKKRKINRATNDLPVDRETSPPSPKRLKTKEDAVEASPTLSSPPSLLNGHIQPHESGAKPKEEPGPKKRTLRSDVKQQQKSKLK